MEELPGPTVLIGGEGGKETKERRGSRKGKIQANSGAFFPNEGGKLGRKRGNRSSERERDAWPSGGEAQDRGSQKIGRGEKRPRRKKKRREKTTYLPLGGKSE